jgi:NitT/TauT family transport system substrate-binding protein
MRRYLLAVAMTAVGLVGGLTTGSALDLFKVASGTEGDWDTSVATYGQKKGFFGAKGLEVEVLFTEGSGASQQAVVSGSADIGIAIGTVGFLAPATKGAPVKIVSAEYTGGQDMLWYVKATSPIRSFKDLTPQTTIAYSTNGSASNISALAIIKQFGVPAKAVATGGPAATLTQVMSGQIDVGYNTDGGLGFGDSQRDVRVIAAGNDLDVLRDLTVRAIITNNDNLTKRRDAVVRFMEVYQQTLDWMYQDPIAIDWFAAQKKVSIADARRIRDAIYPRDSLRLGPIHGIDRVISMAVDFKRIDAPISPETFARYQDIVWIPK